jgi:hypothetical protein
LALHPARQKYPSALADVLTQVLQSEEEPSRTFLVRELAKLDGRRATEQLARRAVFDLSPRVRAEAINTLRRRPLDDSRPIFLAALRHPWAPAADHAAVALAELKDRKAVPDIVALLDQPDPLRPDLDSNQRMWVTTELVQVNHLSNCLLCHSASPSKKDPARGLIPESGKPLPNAYYEEDTGSFVRADLTYLRQDFAVRRNVANAAPWPASQRFDFLVRKRPATAAELETLDEKARTDYPQRQAALYALAALTAPSKQPADGE